MESLCLSLYEMAKRRMFHADDPGRGGRKGWTLVRNLLCASHRARSLTPMASCNPHCNTGSNRLAPHSLRHPCTDDPQKGRFHAIGPNKCRATLFEFVGRGVSDGGLFSLHYVSFFLYPPQHFSSVYIPL